MATIDNKTTATEEASNTTFSLSSPSPSSSALEGFEPGDSGGAMLAGYSIIGGVGILGNCFVITVIASNTKMFRKIPNLYLINQSLADLMGSVMLVITGLCRHALHIKAEELQGWAALVYCRIIAAESLLFAFLLVSTYNLMALTVERYLAIVTPFWHKIHVTRPVAIVTMVVLWIVGVTYVLLDNLFTTDVVDGTCILFSIFPSVFWAQFTAWFNVIAMYVLPILGFVYCYIRIVISLRTSDHFKADDEDNPRAKIMARARKNVLKTLATVTVYFALSWTYAIIPYFLSRIEVLPYTFWSTPWGRLVAISTAVNCSINPIIYALQYTEFKKAARTLFGLKKDGGVKKPPTTPSSNVTTDATTMATISSPLSVITVTGGESRATPETPRKGKSK